MEKNSNLKPISLTRAYKRDWARKSRKTFVGYSRQVYANQKHSSDLRDMDKPNYSLQDFQDWLRGQDAFWELFKKWKETNNRRIQPSVDRIDDRISYTIANIQVTTLWDNLYIKGQKSRIKGCFIWKKTEAGKAHIKMLSEIGAKNLHKRRGIVCEECNKQHITKSAKARFCSRLCEQRSRRRKQKNG